MTCLARLLSSEFIYFKIVHMAVSAAEVYSREGVGFTGVNWPTKAFLFFAARIVIMDPKYNREH